MVAYVSGEGPARGAGIVASVIDAATDAASDYTTSAVVLLFTLAALSLVLLLKRLDDESARREAGGAATPNPDRALRRLLLPPDCLLSYIPPKRVGVVRRNWKPALYRSVFLLLSLLCLPQTNLYTTCSPQARPVCPAQRHKPRASVCQRQEWRPQRCAASVPPALVPECVPGGRPV